MLLIPLGSLAYEKAMLVFDNKKSWLALVFSIRGSALLRIRYRLLGVFLLSVAFTYVQETGRIHSPVNLAAFSLIGLALGVFLGFRNNTSYDRFWEGRRLWGQLVNTSRSLCRDTLNFLALPDQSEANDADASAPSSAQKSQVYRLIAFSHALRMSLRENMRDRVAPTPSRRAHPEANC